MKVPGLFKDECNGKVIAQFISFRPKMYSIIMEGNNRQNPKHGIRKAKGVPDKVVKKEFHHERYNRALFDPKHEDKVTFQAFRSDKHHIYTTEITKVGLSPMDDKKWIADDNITMYAHGDYRLNQTR